MGSETEKFLEAEKAAEDLVNTLAELKSEIESYDSASKELGHVRKDLKQLIDSTQAVVADSHEAVKVIRKIGGPEILEGIKRLERKQALNAENNLKRFKILAFLVLGSILFTAVVGYFVIRL